MKNCCDELKDDGDAGDGDECFCGEIWCTCCLLGMMREEERRKIGRV